MIAIADHVVDRGPGAGVHAGNTVVVIEPDLRVIAHADWVVDLGPGGGNEGGRIVFTGPPSVLLRADDSLTGEHLRRAQPA